jgi:hypothetical protein
VPIEFYGRVVDQNGTGLPDAIVKVLIMHLVLAVQPEGTKRPILERVTGPDGRFEINGVTGDGFDLESITKTGYEAEPTRRGFGPTEGGFANPVIFTMWSTNIHEQLISGAESFHIVPDGSPYMIDLIKGTLVQSGAGDLKAWIKYPAQVVRGETYDWSCGMDSLSGGLLEERNLAEAMYLAPAEGYEPSFEFQQQIKGGQYGSSGSRRFYVRLGNGQLYGSIAVELYAPYTDQIPGLIRLSYAINPSGSRVLR